VEAEVAHVHRRNIERLAEGADVLLDGTDNFETRYLINDFAVSTGRPWVYGAVVGATGLCMPIIPGETPCLRCVFEQAPPPEMNPTADTVGILASAVRLVAAVQSVEAMKILTGRFEDVNRFLLSIDAWLSRFTQINVAAAREQSDCPCCRKRRFDYLEGRLGETSTTYCGRTAVQITPGTERAVDFERIADKLKAAATGPVRYNRFLLKATIGSHLLTLFPDGRAIIGGVSSVEQAQEFYARHIGN
jgi:adenylyltransferase/sulfurtransferase